jgi:hypothetical protein
MLSQPNSSGQLVTSHSVLILARRPSGDSLGLTQMLRIANPIYDSVFKHLMEHLEVAKGLLSCLLGVEILELAACPQEISDSQVVGIGHQRGNVRVFRIDFSALIRLADRSEKRVLIELQKASNTSVTERFRYYLGKHYAIPATQAPVVPIVAIYLLGYWLDEKFPVITRVKRQYLHGLTDTKLTDENGQALSDPFIENLTHDAVVVQIPAIQRDCADHRLAGPAAELAMFLQLFNQKLCDDSKHFLTLSETELANAPTWLKEMLRLLTGAAADQETRNQMRLEDEITVAWDVMVEEVASLKQQKETALAAQEEERRQKEAALQQLAAMKALLAQMQKDQTSGSLG